MFRAEVVPQVAEDLLLIGQSHSIVKVEFEGPAALINEIPRDPELARIVLPVIRDDIPERLRGSRVFTVESGRIPAENTSMSVSSVVPSANCN